MMFVTGSGGRFKSKDWDLAQTYVERRVTIYLIFLLRLCGFYQFAERAVQKTNKSKSNVREYWTGCGDFVLSSAGYSIGLGNILRFPYLCYKNGGGAFLIPYLIFLVIGSFPMFLLEYSLSQFSRRSPLTVWAICPLMKGAGYGMILVNLFFCMYYNVMNSWVLYYLYNSFTSPLPWSSCNNSWNTEHCCSFDTRKCNILYNATEFNNKTTSVMDLTASQEFWRFKVLQTTDGLHDLGSIRVELLICFFLAWFITFLSLCWGIKVSGKIVYFTVTFPYAVLVVFFGLGLTLPGAVDGLKFYILPKWETLLSSKVWVEAALQIFFSSGMGFGGLLTFASYNKFHNNVYRDALIGPMLNSGTSIFAGFTTFTILGVMAHTKGVNVDQVVAQGPGLAFEAYPDAISTFPFPPLWAVLFFLMLLSVAIDTMFGTLEVILCALTDEYPHLLRQRRIILSGFICTCLFALGIPMVTQGGMYILQIIDWYVASFTVMVVVMIECVVIGWIYGVVRFYEDIELMIGYKPCLWWSWCWKFITPSFIVLVLVFNSIQLTPVSYNTYQYPAWAIAIGWIIALSSFVPIPIHMVLSLYREKDNLKQRIKKNLKPLPEWGPIISTEDKEQFDSEKVTETEESLL